MPYYSTADLSCKVNLYEKNCAEKNIDYTNNAKIRRIPSASFESIRRNKINQVVVSDKAGAFKKTLEFRLGIVKNILLELLIGCYERTPPLS